MWWLINYIIGFIFFVVIAYKFRRDTDWLNVDGEFFPIFVWVFAIIWPLSLIMFLICYIIEFLHKHLIKL